MAGDLLAAVSAPLNRRILAVLAVEPNYARRIAALLDAGEAEVSRRLRALERLGLLSSAWQREASNVKVYSLRASSLRLEITSGGIQLSQQSAPPRPAPPAPAAPRPPVDGFVGRATDLALLAQGDPVVIVEGLPGSGKTTLLARHVQGSDALWFTCRGTETLAWLAAQLAHQLAAQGDEGLRRRLHADGSDVARLLLERLQRPGTVTVLDDVHRISDPVLRGFLDDATASFGEGRLLLASRERVAHARRPGVRVLELGGLEDDEAAALLAHAGIDVPDRLVGRLRDEVGGHPLALTLLAEAAQGGGLEHLLDRRPERELTHYLLEEIDASLSTNERTALGHASVFPHTFEAGDLEVLGTRMAEAALTGLWRRRLVSADEQGYRLPEVVRNFFYERLQDRPRLHRAAADRLGQQTEIAAHLEAMHHLLAAGDRSQVVQRLAQDLDIQDYHEVDAGHQRMYREILERFARDEVGDALWAQILDELGDLAFHAGDWHEARARYGEASDLFLEHHPERYGDTRWKCALCLEQEGRHAEAAQVCEEAMPLAKGKRLARLTALREQLVAHVLAS